MNDIQALVRLIKTLPHDALYALKEIITERMWKQEAEQKQILKNIMQVDEEKS
jgi:hypothetical protein